MTISITYPLLLPTAPGIKHVKMDIDSAVAITESPFTFESQTYAHQGQRWKAVITLPAMKRVQAELWIATMLMLNGRQGWFLLGDPDAKNPQGVATGVPMVNGSNQVGNNLLTRGWTLNTTHILKAGDYVQLGTGAEGDTTTRMHKVLKDANSDAGGDATLLIWPNLRYSPSDGAPITVTSCKTQFRLDAPFGYDADEVSTYSVQFSASEKLP